MKVDLPGACEQFLELVDLPAVTEKTNASVAFVLDDAALITAIDRLAAARECFRKERLKYAGNGGKED